MKRKTDEDVRAPSRHVAVITWLCKLSNLRGKYLCFTHIYV